MPINQPSALRFVVPVLPPQSAAMLKPYDAEILLAVPPWVTTLNISTIL